MNARSVSRSLVMAVASLSMVACNGVEPGADPGEVSQALTGPTQVATTSPTSLVQSTGNLYWTSRRTQFFPRLFTATLWRAGKSNTPGQEIALYSEQSTTAFSFGGVTYAQVGGVWYGFFAVNYNSTSAAIKRVPLTGGSAVTLATVTSPIGRRIATDGQNVYFGDSTGVRFCSVYGGGADTLASTASAVVGVGYAPWHLFYATTTAVYNYNFYSGATSTIAISGYPPVGDLSVTPPPAGTPDATVVWTDAYGVFAWRGSSYNLFGAPGPGRIATSASFDGTNVLYTECTTTNTTCTADVRPYSGLGYAGYNVAVGDGANFIQGDAAQFFYGASSGLFKVTY